MANTAAYPSSLAGGGMCGLVCDSQDEMSGTLSGLLPLRAAAN